MITDNKIQLVQNKIKAAIAKIEADEKVKITFGSCRYNSAYYTTSMKVCTTEETKESSNAYLTICKMLGFTQNILGMKFNGRNGVYEITEIKTKNRKYPIIAIDPNGKSWKYTVDQIKLFIGGDKIINRNANLDKLVGK